MQGELFTCGLSSYSFYMMMEIEAKVKLLEAKIEAKGT